VGIPARIIIEDADKRREEQAAKMGFSAYAITRSTADDPVSMALNRLIDHVAEQERRIESLQEDLRRLAAQPEAEPPKARLQRVGH
jgi:serine O-acetyltransferase